MVGPSQSSSKKYPGLRTRYQDHGEDCVFQQHSRNSYQFENDSRNSDGTDVRRRVNINDAFKTTLAIPTTNELKDWKRLFASVETSLRQWYQNKNSPDAKENTLLKWKSISTYVKAYTFAASKLFRIDTTYFLENELDSRVWKYGLYQFIVSLREQVSSDLKYKSAIRAAYKDVFEQGSSHFKDLLIHAPSILGIDLKPILQRTGFFRGSSRKIEPTKKELLIYRLLIALGDLYRYSYEVTKMISHAKMAADMYTAARYCDSEKSRAYNQLGVMAKAQNDIMGTIYHFTRAFSAPTPADGARDQLLYAYDDIYKQFTAKRAEFWTTMTKMSEKSLKGSCINRKDIWLPNRAKKNDILPKLPVLPISKIDYLKNLADNDVFTQFCLTFSHFLGKLYTKIGTETLEEAGKEVIVYFEGLVIHESALKFSFLMEVIALILYITDYLTPTVDNTTSPGAVSQMKYMRDIAVNTTLQMVSCLSKRAVGLIKKFDWDSPMLTKCGAALHVWCRWAKRRSFVWNGHLKSWKLPKSAKGKLETGLDENSLPFLCLYSELTVLFERCSNYVFPEVSTGSKGLCQTQFGILPEQLVLDGFADILFPKDFDLNVRYYDGRHSRERAYNHCRLYRVLTFAKRIFGERNLTNFKQIIQRFNKTTTESIPEGNMLNHIYESLVPNPRKYTYGKPDCNNARVIMRKAAGTDKIRRKQVHLKSTKVHELWTNLSAMGVKTEMIIQPSRLVLDTNCFIRELEWIKVLMAITRGQLLIPSPVIMELRGLSQGVKCPKVRGKQRNLDETKTKMINSMVTGEQSMKALEFIHEHRYNFAVVSVSGNRMKMYNFHKHKIYDDWLNPGVTNDEKILGICRLLEARDEKLRRLDSPLRLFRNTVLVTGDRSLRIRAYSTDIPARDIQSLTAWLQVNHQGT